MSELVVTLVQADLRWEAPQANHQLFDRLLEGVSGSDLVVLPEMFATGFTMQVEEAAEPAEGSDTLAWMKRKASELGAVITGSLSINSGGHYVNRMYWVTPEGEVSYYDKRHLFRMGEEANHYSAGDQRVIKELKGVRVLLSVCYDLRFPVWLRNRANEYDLLVCVANWPSSRRKVWRTLLQARALENQSYVVGVNRCGKDGNELHYSGDSMLVDYLGETLIDEPENVPFVRTGVIGLESLNRFREKFPAWKDADDFTLTR
ncbi:amidohydrolase [Carnimonas bestiolae]|uniref:amidohydrolase n=1 Tax=Carnimonas bestiolae TaxID=3402172 RepID=UPI003EDC291B